MKSVIYETKGRAREFNSLAINLFTGCGHRCSYCYGADVTHQDKESFENNPKPRVTLHDIEQSAKQWRNAGRPILLCFVTDPYQPIESETQLTRNAIKILHNYGLNVIILTKGGLRATRDFDLLTPQDAFAVTLTLLDDIESKKWEGGASLPSERIESLKRAKEKGIPTWVSLEPVIYPEKTIELVRQTYPLVGHYKVGTLNYHPHGQSIDWAGYGWKMKRLLDSLGGRYYFKKDLLKEMRLAPYQFKQTFTCF